MTGSGDLYLNNVDLDPDRYKNLAFIASDTVLTEESTQTQNYDTPRADNPITSLGGGLSSDGKTFAPGNEEYIGEPNQEVYDNVEGFVQIDINDTIGTSTDSNGNVTTYNLTDDYKLYIEYNFYTSHLPPVVDNDGPKLDNFGAMEFLADIEYINPLFVNTVFTEANLVVDKVELTAWKPSDPNNLTGPHIKGKGQSVTINIQPSQVYVPANVSQNRAPIVETRGATSGLGINNRKYVRINFDSTQIYNALRQVDSSGFPVWLESGKTEDYRDSQPDYGGDTGAYLRDPSLNDYLDYYKGAYLQWKVISVITLPNPPQSYTNLDSDVGYKLRIKRRGSITNILASINAYARKSSTLTTNQYTGTEGYAQLNAYRCFNPPGIEDINRHYLKFDLRGLLTPSSENLGIANAPYWDFVDGDRSRIYLIPPLLNNNYGSSYYQSPSPYVPSINTAFPFSKEPPYTIIPTPSDPLEFFPGDQIRFVNLESQVYTVVNVDQGTVNGNQRVILNLDRNIANGINLDFFLIRRFKPANNFVILNQQKPYGVPPSASSSPGILQTQYQNEELEINPDKVITNLIERNLI